MYVYIIFYESKHHFLLNKTSQFTTLIIDDEKREKKIMFIREIAKHKHIKYIYSIDCHNN